MDTSALRTYIMSAQRSVSSLVQRSLNFKVVNVAQDVGKPSSTGLYYFTFVDQGRGSIAFTTEVQKGKNKGKKVAGLAFKSSPNQWVFTRQVRASTPLRITNRINDRIKAAIPGVVRDITGAAKGLPDATMLKMLSAKMRLVAIEISIQAAHEAIGTGPGSSGPNQRTRLYGITDATSIEEGFRILEG